MYTLNPRNKIVFAREGKEETTEKASNTTSRISEGEQREVERMKAGGRRYNYFEAPNCVWIQSVRTDSRHPKLRVRSG